ncbi:MAG: NfeD family protein [Anaerolineae bacterium]
MPYWRFLERQPMKRLLTMSVLMLLLFTLFLTPTVGQAESSVLVVQVKGIINPLTVQYLQRSLNRAREQGASLVVIVLDTPGGLESAMRTIVEEILQSPVPTAVYVSPNGARATSAGMYITLAANVAAMAPATHIGAAHPVPLGGEVDAVMAEKMVSDAAALVRAIASKRTRNVAWAESAVRENLSLTASEALEMNVIDLVADNLDDLLVKLDGRNISTDGETVSLRTTDMTQQAFNMNLIERVMHVISDPNIAYLLLTFGTLLLLAELANPGLSLTGIGSAVCYIVALLALGNLPVNWAGVALLSASVVFFIVGLLTNTEAIVTVAGLVPFILGSLLLFSPSSLTSLAAPLIQVSPWLIAFMTIVFLFATAIVFRALLRARKLPPQSGAESLIGLEGTALSELSPAGRISVNQQEWSALSDQDEIHAGQMVRVVGFTGVHLLVTAVVSDTRIKGGN